MVLDSPIVTLHERIEGMDNRALGWAMDFVAARSTTMSSAGPDP